MTHGSLFSGIGGIDLGFEWAGIETKWQVEIDDYCQKLLSLRFPHTKKFTDVRKVGSHNLEKVDIISGGFPCQDISVAGKGAGLEGERSGLWTELHRVISELRPRFAFIENVPMLTIRGGTRVISDLTEIGYDAEWTIISAKDVGAWHRRKRIWICAYPEVKWTGESREPDKKKRIEGSHKTQSYRFCEDVPDTKLERPAQPTRESGTQKLKRIHNNKTRDGGTIRSKISGCGGFRRRGGLQNGWTIEPKLGLLADGLSTGLGGYWDREPDIPRVATGIKDRVSKLKGLGNAVVPQVAALIMEKIKDAEFRRVHQTKDK